MKERQFFRHKWSTRSKNEQRYLSFSLFLTQEKGTKRDESRRFLPFFLLSDLSIASPLLQTRYASFPFCSFTQSFHYSIVFRLLLF